MLPVDDHVPVAGSYSSADVRNTSGGPSGAVVLSPPATSTLPSARSVAVCPKRGTDLLPVTDQVRLGGSYTSAALRTYGGVGPKPPTSSTRPSASRVAVCDERGCTRLPASDQLPEAGS